MTIRKTYTRADLILSSWFCYTYTGGAFTCICIIILYITGITGTVKAIIAESSVTSNQQALGLSVVATSWGVGLIAGPAVGGALSDPINQFNLNISSMHARGVCLINMNSSYTVVVVV